MSDPPSESDTLLTRRHMDAVAWTLFAIGLALVAIATYVMVELSLRLPPAAADGMKPILYMGGVFTFTSIGAKTGLLDRLKPLLGG